MKAKDLIEGFPKLYHMAEEGSWSNILSRGLLSTSRLLDLYGYSGEARDSIERCHRPESVELAAAGLPPAVVRDQKPMSDAGLRRALPEGLSPAAWYVLLNSKVFFWTSENRLHRLLNARPYRDKVHDVLIVSTEALLRRHEDNVLLCPMNSGCTRPKAHPRDPGVFSSIEDYPYESWKKKRPTWDAVVELAIEGGMSDVSDCVIEVRQMRGQDVLQIIWPNKS